MGFHPATPILRIFDEAKAREFYVGFLGFRIDWEHSFADDLPLYAQVSLGDCVIHLSEHHGDCCPGAALRIRTDALADLHSRLTAAQYRHARSGLEDTPWGTRELRVSDPFGNRLVFFEEREG
jgi:uncharacterized glyoxalase superfamily protein PhnB